MAFDRDITAADCKGKQIFHNFILKQKNFSKITWFRAIPAEFEAIMSCAIIRSEP